ncbi:DUF86 domain-containing protein [Oscillatoria sp. CS-180]|uniref:HepT-like ribonuclease domain-containing protein n=1 Tax=Oscillatoria sp. CS-180 TaxID=3021720 RepID=UPI00232D1E91|nr:HepT-like ribonuclease domain-containing protein [Oscillatoria sp. CS-180]MDB9528138.1 DUF86 domain-containing protein [Oscillatoria sp. CS-180]
MKDSRLYLVHIADCVDRIEVYTVEGKAAFMADTKTQDAVIRNLEVMCESTRQLPDAWKAAHIEVDWRQVSDFRNFLAHQYLDVDLEIIWNVVANYLPQLKAAVDAMQIEF